MLTRYLAPALLALTLSCAAPAPVQQPVQAGSQSQEVQPPETVQTPPQTSQPERKETSAERSFREHRQKMLQVLQETFAYCSGLTFEEKVDAIFTHLVDEKYRRNSERTDCLEYGLVVFQGNSWDYAVARVPLHESCITGHAQEIAEDQQHLRDKQWQRRTAFPFPVDYGLQLGSIGYVKEGKLDILVLFPDAQEIPPSYFVYLWSIGEPGAQPLSCEEHPLGKKYCSTAKMVEEQLRNACVELLMREEGKGEKKEGGK